MQTTSNGVVSARIPTPKNPDELWEYVRAVTGIRIPRIAVCADHCSPFDAFAAAYFALSPLEIWWASRGFGGKTFMLALLAYIEEVSLNANTVILGGSGGQSTLAHEYHDGWWALPQAPVHMLRGKRSATITRLVDGGGTRALAASQTSVRGKHPERTRLDEIDEMKQAIYDAAQGLSMSRANRFGEYIRAQTVASSTWQWPNGTMKYVMDMARERGWPIRKWCWRETVEPHGWLSLEEVETKRKQVPTLMWETEYEGAEPAVGDRAIDLLAVEDMFDAGLGTYGGWDDEYVECEAPVPEGRYVTGADWARKVDKTAITTIRVDVTPARIVAFEQMNRRTWGYMIGRFIARLKRYKGVGNHDATGLGDVIQDNIESHADYKLLQQMKVKVQGTILVGRERDGLLSEYIADVEQTAIKSPRIEYLYNQHKYATRAEIFGSRDEGHLPDGLCSVALAWRVRNVRGPSAMVAPVSFTGASQW